MLCFNDWRRLEREGGPFLTMSSTLSNRGEHSMTLKSMSPTVAPGSSCDDITSKHKINFCKRRLGFAVKRWKTSGKEASLEQEKIFGLHHFFKSCLRSGLWQQNAKAI